MHRRPREDSDDVGVDGDWWYTLYDPAESIGKVQQWMGNPGLLSDLGPFTEGMDLIKK